jgi:hypothetical protein
MNFSISLFHFCYKLSVIQTNSVAPSDTPFPWTFHGLDLRLAFVVMGVRVKCLCAYVCV